VFLLLKDGSFADSTCFQDTGVNICCDGCRYLGSAIENDNFVLCQTNFRLGMMNCHCLLILLGLNLMLPFPLIFMTERKWTVLYRTTPSISYFFKDLDTLIQISFHSLRDQTPANSLLRLA